MARLMVDIMENKHRDSRLVKIPLSEIKKGTTFMIRDIWYIAKGRATRRSGKWKIDVEPLGIGGRIRAKIKGSWREGRKEQNDV